jgi:hypothetical protein
MTSPAPPHGFALSARGRHAEDRAYWMRLITVAFHASFALTIPSAGGAPPPCVGRLGRVPFPHRDPGRLRLQHASCRGGESPSSYARGGRCLFRCCGRSADDERTTVQEFHWHESPPRDAAKSVGTLDVPVSGVLIAVAAQTTRRFHALGVCVEATTAILSRRAPRILPESLGGSGCGVAYRHQYCRWESQEVFHRSLHH